MPQRSSFDALYEQTRDYTLLRDPATPRPRRLAAATAALASHSAAAVARAGALCRQWGQKRRVVSERRHHAPVRPPGMSGAR